MYKEYGGIKMNGVCGANCSECVNYQNQTCQGCQNTNACPFGKKCWIASYIEMNGMEQFEHFEDQLLEEINSFNIAGMPTVEDLFPLHGAFVNLEYPLPNGEKAHFLQNLDTYLGNQLECDFNDDEIQRYYGVVANMNFILICEYGEDGRNPELIVYKKR